MIFENQLILLMLLAFTFYSNDIITTTIALVKIIVITLVDIFTCVIAVVLLRVNPFFDLYIVA